MVAILLGTAVIVLFLLSRLLFNRKGETPIRLRFAQVDISVTVPGDWKKSSESGSYSFYSPETFLQTDKPLTAGCKVTVSGMDNKENLTQDSLITKVRDQVKGSEVTVLRHEIIKRTLQGELAVSAQLETEETGYMNSLYVLSKGKIYTVILYANRQDIDKCNAYFGRIIDSLQLP